VHISDQDPFLNHLIPFANVVSLCLMLLLTKTMTNAENLRFYELISNLQSVIDQIKGIFWILYR